MVASVQLTAFWCFDDQNIVGVALGILLEDTLVEDNATCVRIGLDNGEALNIIDFSDSISTFADKPVIKSSKTAREAKAYIEHIQANGGTNINDAMLEAIRAEPTPGMLPMVLFLTDGCPTVGERSESKIRDAIKAVTKK